MPTFTITTTATEALKADSKGHAEVVFTVTNTSPKPARGLAKAKALDNTKQEWLTLRGESERDFAPAATQQFVVSFDGPLMTPGSPVGKAAATQPSSAHESATGVAAAPTKYRFRLDIANAAKPDEDFTEGQVVTVEAAVGKKKTGFPIWIIPVAAVVLIGIGVGLWLLLRPKNVAVPNVVGMSLADARATIEQAKLKVAEDETTQNVAEGQVTDQTPKPGESVKKGTEIKLVLEPAVVVIVVPDVTKRLVDDAKQRILDAGFTPVTVATPLTEGFQPNQVVTQKPGPNEQAPPGSQVELSVAVQKAVKVPDVRFNPLALAKQKLTDAGLTSEELPPELADASVAPGNVKSQNPDPGAEVPPNSSVKLVIAATPVEVPPLKDRKIAEAHALLQQRGLELGGVHGTYNESNAATVTIINQAPAAFTQIAKGSKVTAYVPCIGRCRWYVLEGLQIKTSVIAVQPKASGIQPKTAIP